MKKLILSTGSAVLLTVAMQSPAYASDWLSKAKEYAEEKVSENVQGKSSAEVIGANLSDSEIVSGLKDALGVGAEKVIKQLSAADGFNGDKAVRIPLPKSLEKARSIAEKAGLGSQLDDLELKLNRAAEAAAPKAGKLFADAIKDMSLEDARGILNGPENAATAYFKENMQGSLKTAMQPVINESLSDVGALKAYELVAKDYAKLPFVPDLKGNISDHVAEKGMDGIFLYLAKEEAAIRKDPIKRTTDILKKVFE